MSKSKIKPLTISLILGAVIIIINFGAYFTFQLFLGNSPTILEGIGFTIWDTFLELIIVMPLSFALSGGFNR